MRLPDGAVHSAGFRRVGYDLLHRQHHFRRVSGKALCPAAPLEAFGPGGASWKEERAGLLRSRRSGESETVVLNCRRGLPARSAMYRFAIVASEYNSVITDRL